MDLNAKGSGVDGAGNSVLVDDANSLAVFEDDEGWSVGCGADVNREVDGDVVADFFCGSGTSLVVAKELGRNYIGCDINPKAIEITNNRLMEIN